MRDLGAIDFLNEAKAQGKIKYACFSFHDNYEAFEEIIRHMKECGVGYGSVNHPVDRDPVCGYTGVIGDVCPRCGRREGESVTIERLNELRKKYPGVPVPCDCTR